MSSGSGSGPSVTGELYSARDRRPVSPTGYAKQRNSASRQRCRSTALARPLGRLAPAGHARKVPRRPVYQGRRPPALILHYPGHCPPRRSRPRDHSEGPPGRRQPPPVLIDRHRRPRRIMILSEHAACHMHFTCSRIRVTHPGTRSTDPCLTSPCRPPNQVVAAQALIYWIFSRL